MSDIDTRPQEINIDHYGGDTLALNVTVPSNFVDGRNWAGQVRRQPASPRLDASFVITTTVTGATVELPATACKQLCMRGKYSGYWDLQLADPDGERVTTLAYGRLTIWPDVTSVEAA